jgi:hypothetical protein
MQSQSTIAALLAVTLISIGITIGEHRTAQNATEAAQARIQSLEDNLTIALRGVAAARNQLATREAQLDAMKVKSDLQAEVIKTMNIKSNR